MEIERLKAVKLSDSIFVAESSSRKALGKRSHKYNQKGKRSDLDQKKPNAKKHPRGKRTTKKRDKSKVRCYNCNKLGHLSHECIEPKKVRPNSTLLNYVLVTSSVLLIESLLVWNVDSGADNNRDVFMVYRQISQGVDGYIWVKTEELRLNE